MPFVLDLILLCDIIDSILSLLVNLLIIKNLVVYLLQRGVVMAQETWALKLDSDLKEKLQDIIRSDFDSSKEFMEQLVNMYELHQLKQGENILVQEVEELEALTRRINGIFINANAKINTMLQDKDTKIEQQTELKQKLIEKLQGDIIKLEQENNNIGDINDELVNLNDKKNEEVNQLTRSTSTLEELVAEYKDKNDTLTGLLAEYNQDREQNKELQSEINKITSKLQENILKHNNESMILSQKADYLQEKCAKYENDIIDIDEKYRVKIEDITNRNAIEQENMRISLEMEKNKAILDIQKDHQDGIHTLQEKHNTEIEQYQSKYKELLEKIESMAKTNRKAMPVKTSKVDTK